MTSLPHISRENGKKGGRPRGSASLEAERIREEMIMRVGQYVPIIFDALVAKAKTGDVAAIKELFDRTVGKAGQSIDLTTKGDKLDGSDAVKKLSKKFDGFFKSANG